MGRGAGKSDNISGGIAVVSKILQLIGKPFYLVIVLLIIIFSFFATLINQSVNEVTAFMKSAKLPRLKLKLTIPKPVLKLPQIKIPEIRVKKPEIFTKLKIAKLRIELKLIRPKKIRLSFKKFLLFFLLIVFIVSGFSFWYVIIKDLPSPKELTSRPIDVSTKIYDRNGLLLYTIYKDQNRTPIPLSDIPLHVRLATLAAEDAEFYQHPGFSIRGIFRAIVKNVRDNERFGGSTITQQLVKNALLTSEKTLIRKTKEVILAIEVEITYSKDEILEMYLNEVSYGGTAYGIEQAANVYFDKTTSELSIPEAALLAGLPKSPTHFSPFGAHPELAEERMREVLHLMQINGFIAKDQEEEFKEVNIQFAQNKTDILAPHFVMYVKDQLVQMYGEELVEKGGLSVTTTLDWEIQQLAEEVVKSEVASLNNLHVTNGAVVVINPQTGEVLAMVGSKDYFNTAEDGNVNVTTRERQPGSSIKIVNYSYALSHGYTPATRLKDTPITYQIPGQEPYSPKNYDGRFRGNLSLRSALAQSRNVPAVKVLASYGVDKMIEQGQKMGITTWVNPYNYGLSLTLGGGGVKLIDLATAYSTIANYGRRPDVSGILEVKNYKDKTLFENSCEQSCGQQVIDPRVAFMLTDILRDNKARTPAFGSNSLLVIPNHPEVAVKTGTSNDLRDNLAIGYNQDYLVAAWVGNNDNSPMSRVASGITGATPIWHKIIAPLLDRNAYIKPWQVPEGLVNVGICSITGTLSCTGCPTNEEWFLVENAPQTYCNSDQIFAILNKQQEQKAANGEGQIL